MTLAVEKSRSADRRLAPRVWSQDELERLRKLAERLHGRPLPGVHLTEDQFWAQYGDEDIKAEWVDGKVIVIPPASRDHVWLNNWLVRLMSEFVDINDVGEVAGPEFPIRLASIRISRIPDIIFVGKSKSHLIRPTFFEGAPDLIVEIVSPDSLARDWRDKYADYQAVGVREYWVVDPMAKQVDVYALSRLKKFSQIKPDDQGRIHSKVLKALFIDPQWLWRSPLPKLASVLKELKLR
jgi:Uma2 family endonuclease